MIVHDFHVTRVAVGPHEADPVRIVDANAMLAIPVAFKRFKVVAWKRGQVLQGFRLVRRSRSRVLEGAACLRS
jgi:hypothetical protein